MHVGKVLLAGLVVISSLGQEPLSPEESLKKIQVSNGFRVELVVAEPLVVDPVAIDWDAAGRLWVVEMADYPLGVDGKGKAGGRVRVIEDSDGDGKLDRSKVFADGLNFPTGLITWRDGVIVTAAPEVLFLKDSDGDGRADVREVLFSGFLEGNQQLRVNGLRWGLDNWIYCAVGGHYRGYGAATKIRSHKTGAEVALGSRDFRFRPDTGEFEPESGPSQFGRNRDDWGHWFGTQNSNPLWHYVTADRYARRNPHVAVGETTRQVITPVNPKIFPASVAEKRYHSFEHADHFTSACAGMIYGDDLLFGAREMNAFVCEPVHNMVHREIITDDGVSFRARRAAGEETSEFFASEDRWCRPVMTRTGPDGALWVVDMYRYMIEHPDWLPENGREELLPHYRKGDDRGRIYRVLPKSGMARAAVKLEGRSGKELVAALESSNGWTRDKAQQMLLWRQETNVVRELRKLMKSRNALARAQALAVLDGLGLLTEDLVTTALRDEHAGVRENAWRTAERFAFPKVDVTAETSAKVRLQMAFSFGEWKDTEAGEALARLARVNQDEPFLVAAVVSSAMPHLEILTTRLAGLKAYAEPLIGTCLEAGRSDLVETLLAPVVNAKEFGDEQFRIYGMYLKLMARRKMAAPNHAQILAAARSSMRTNFSAALLLARIPTERAGALPLLAEALQPKLPIEDQRMTISAMVESGDDSVPRLLLRNWANHGPNTRAAILEAMLRREGWTLEMLGAVNASDIDVARRNRLLKHASAHVRELAEKLFKATASNRAEGVENFRPARSLEGNAARGKEIYAKACLICHQRDNSGNEIGPDLRTVVEHSPEKLLANILDPSADIQPGYHAYTCVLQTGEEVYGLVAAENENSVVMKLADGSKRTLLRAEIKALMSSNTSLMPDGLESGMTEQDLADLISYLRAR